MRSNQWILTLLSAALATTLAACQPADNATDNTSKDANEKAAASPASGSAAAPANSISPADKALWDQAQGLFKPLPAQAEAPATNPGSDAKVALGKMLFFEPRLSKSGAFSCNSCHNLATYGVDNRSTSIGHGFKTGDRNSPTVLNATFNLAQFWDGRAADLEAQAAGPVLNPGEMAMPDEKAVLARLKSIPQYNDAFAAAFGSKDALSYKNMTHAIAAFERTLLTPSAFDRFLAGDGNALKPEQKEGLKTFISTGCTACHSGIGVGGGMYQKFGLVKAYVRAKDPGRSKVTGKASDQFFFKVPLLRNITHTYPYFHDGSVWDLKEAVRIMGETQLGKQLPPADVDKIVAFLDSLTGDVPDSARLLPQLPPSGPDTPKPEI